MACLRLVALATSAAVAVGLRTQEAQEWVSGQARLHHTAHHSETQHHSDEALPPAHGDGHFWPSARGRSGHQFGQTEVQMPWKLGGALAWRWQHPKGRHMATIAGGPAIDNAKNVYLTTSEGSVFKVDSNGKTLWHYDTPGVLNNAPALAGDLVLGNTQTGHAFALNRQTGKPVWVKQISSSVGPDAGYPAASEGIFVMGGEVGHDPRSPGGCNRVIGVNATSGVVLWDFRPDVPVWNLAPLFPKGDGSVVFMDFTGGVYKLGLHNGKQRWHFKSVGSEGSFSDGGATLGPNGVAYACSNPGFDRGYEGQWGLLRALDLSDGSLQWEQVLPQPCNSYPAVGHLKKGKDLSVVVTPGSFMGQKRLHGSVMAFDAKTGEPQWRYQMPVYTSVDGMAKGDTEGYKTRVVNDPAHSICLPAHWSSANIAGDGTVYAARCDGFIYGVKGPSGRFARMEAAVRKVDRSHRGTQSVHLTDLVNLTLDFASTPGALAEAFDAGDASLHGAFAFAPGMMAVATCDSLLVFKH